MIELSYCGRWMILLTVTLAMTAVRVSAQTTLWEDNLDGYVAATSWRDNSTDADPGGVWIFPAGESPDSAVQVLRAPTDAGGGDGAPIPSMTADPNDQYLHQARRPGDTSYVQAVMSGASQAAIRAAGIARLELDYYIDTQSPWGTGSQARIGALDRYAVNSGTNPSTPNELFDLNFNKDGTVEVFIIQDDCCALPEPFQHTYTELPALSTAFVPNTWQHLTVDMDFNSVELSVTIDETTVSSIPFGEEYDGGVAIPWTKFDVVRTLMIDDARAAFDNFEVSIPPPAEPSTEFTWNLSGLGDWNALGSWSPANGAPPSTVEHAAIFKEAISAPSTVVVDEPVTINRIVFDNAVNGYAVAGKASVNLVEGSLEEIPKIEVLAGDHEFQVDVNLLNDTTVNVATDAKLTFDNSLTLGDKVLTKIGDGTLAINNDLVSSGGTINCQVGTCSGSGTVGGDLNNSSGTVSPGNSPGMLTVDGNYNQESGGTLAIEIGGTQAEVDYDVLNVLGNASLAGILDVSLINGFTPSGGNTFKVLTAGGELTDAGLTLGGSAAGSFTMSVDTTNDWIMLMTTGGGGGVPGDYNGNGTVDAADYTIFRDNLGGDSAVLSGNGSGAATVVQADYDLWKQNFGSSGTGSTAAVPEPCSYVLMALGLFALVACRGRQKSQ
jgi:hypothetical protein